MYKGKPDIIIKNGRIVDGTGKDSYFADIAMVGDKIDYIGDLSGVDAQTVIDASGKFITPGFINSHTHSDWTMWASPEFQSAVRQGVTTEIVGNCGFSMRHDLTNIPFDKAGDGIKCVYDINVFNLDNLKINATFADPCQYSEGMDYVFVNGKAVIEKGEHTKMRAGKVLRHTTNKQSK